jgi:hypothetical protein
MNEIKQRATSSWRKGLVPHCQPNAHPSHFLSDRKAKHFPIDDRDLNRLASGVTRTFRTPDGSHVPPNTLHECIRDHDWDSPSRFAPLCQARTGDDPKGDADSAEFSLCGQPIDNPGCVPNLFFRKPFVELFKQLSAVQLDDRHGRPLALTH